MGKLCCTIIPAEVREAWTGGRADEPQWPRAEVSACFPLPLNFLPSVFPPLKSEREYFICRPLTF